MCNFFRWVWCPLASIWLLTGGVGLQAAQSLPDILVEAESFADRGGWKLDTQFIHEMGSPYLLASLVGIDLVLGIVVTSHS